MSLCAVVALPSFTYAESAEDIKKAIPKFYNVYCSPETATSLDIAVHSLDQEVSDEDLQTIKETIENWELKYKFDTTLPQVYIATDNGSGESYGTTLTKAIGYVPAQITIVSTDSSIIASDMSSEIKVRGNWTATQPKKPYNIKFAKGNKPDLFGMGYSRKWALLADIGDPTLMRNKIALDLGKALSLDATPDTRCQAT